VPQKLINFILKFYLYFLNDYKERKLSQGARETFTDLLSTCLLVMEFRVVF